MSSDSVEYSIEQGVAILTLNRPDRLNAMSQSMSTELVELLDRADKDPDIKAVILTGAGRSFCVGADLSLGAQTFAAVEAEGSNDRRDWGGVLVLRLFQMMKPTIAAINGAAVGIGATMTLPCDVRIASSHSKFGFVFARRGIVLDGCASWFLPRIVGISTALQWCLSGDLIGADQALEAKLVSSLHDEPQVLQAALDIAVKLTAQTSPVSVALCRRLLWQGLTENHPMQAHQFESKLIEFSRKTDDAREGVESFLGKRKAEFRGRVPRDLPPDWPPWREPEFG